MNPPRRYSELVACIYACLAFTGCNHSPNRAIKLLAPITAQYTGRDILFKWDAPGVAGLTLDVCGSRDCVNPLLSIPVAGSEHRTFLAVRPGAVFWRMRGYSSESGASEESFVWEFFHGDRYQGAGVGQMDFNGDGFPDVLFEQLLVLGGAVPRTRKIDFGYVPDGAHPFGQTAGDINGDGYSDLIAGFPCAGPRICFQGRVNILLGGPDGFLRNVPIHYEGESLYFGTSVRSPGDIDGDGTWDIVMTDTQGATILFGTQGEWGRNSVMQLPDPDGFILADPVQLQDVDGDGLADVGFRLHREGADPVSVAIFTDRARTRTILDPGSGTSVGFNEVAAADLDGDRHSDPVLAWAGYDRTKFPGFPSPQLRIVSGAAAPPGSLIRAIAPPDLDPSAGGFDLQVSAADLDGDGLES
jgi:hypothetical protein